MDGGEIQKEIKEGTGTWDYIPDNLPDFIYKEFGPETTVYLFYGVTAKKEKREIHKAQFYAGFSFTRKGRYTFKTTLKEAANAAENMNYFIVEESALELSE